MLLRSKHQVNNYFVHYMVYKLEDVKATMAFEVKYFYITPEQILAI